MNTLKKAAELLCNRSANVSEIAYETGFKNLSYFTSCFKKEYGAVPSAYFELMHPIKRSYLALSKTQYFEGIFTDQTIRFISVILKFYSKKVTITKSFIYLFRI